MLRKPLVGIIADRRQLGNHAFHCVGEKYITAVSDGAGAYATILPALMDRVPIEDTLSHFDGLLFTGSPSMVGAEHYGGAAQPEGTWLDPYRDATALPLIRAAVDAGVPVFGICRGFQEMNVAFGGSLLQAIQTDPSKLDHREDDSEPLDVQYAPAHEVELVEGGLLRGIARTKRVLVNSLHQQGVDRLGKGLRVEARAPDGLIEAFRVADAKSFALAVQWHPEWRFAENSMSAALFAAFGDACRQRGNAVP